MKKIAVLTGAGISAESGLKTFRDAGGLWEGHDVMEVASIEGWKNNPKLVLDFYNARRAQLKEVHPNEAHQIMADLEKNHEVVIITQNVDDLHERAGSSHVIHLHGELRKIRPINSSVEEYWEEDIFLGSTDSSGAQYRPAIVWFGEAVPRIEAAVGEIINADIVIIIGTSMQVYPAAGLIQYAPAACQIYYIDPAPSVNWELQLKQNLTIIEEKAVDGARRLLELLSLS